MNTEAQTTTLTKTLTYAPLSARLLALFIDYIFLSALIFFTEKAIQNSDYVFLITFFMTGSYFTFCNSELCTGQTLGKKVLGLKTLSSNGKILLDPAKSFLRFMLSFGAIIVLSEIPNFFYRKQGIVASPFVLEFNMFLVMLMCSISLLFSALTGSHRSLHDILCKTIVVRDFPVTSVDEELNLQFKSSRKNKALLFTIAFFIALFLWLLGVVQPNAISIINKRKYLIEKKLNTRILSLGLSNQKLEWISLIPSSNNANDIEEAKKLTSYLEENKLVNKEQIKEIHFMFHHENASQKDVPRDNKPQINQQAVLIYDTQTSKIREAVR